MRTIRKTLSLKSSPQSGINMVDLMMWLVIAALLLSAAIQGIGYYQQGAYLYQMKEAASGASSRVMAEASMNNGKVTQEILTSVVGELNSGSAEDEITLSWDSMPSYAAGAEDSGAMFSLVSATTSLPAASSAEVYFIRATHDAANRNDVVFLFNDTASLRSGLHAIDKGELGDGSDSEEPTTPEPTPTATPTPTPTPTPEPTPPPNSIVAGANISEHTSFKPLFTDRSVSSTTSTMVQYLFTIPGVVNTSDYEVTWSGTSLQKTNSAFVTKSSTTNKYWFIDVTPANATGFTTGESYYTATVKNIATGEVSVKTWKLTVTEAAIAANPSFTALYTDRTISAASMKVQYVFYIPGATLSEYSVVWTGGSSVNATPQGKSGTNYGNYWFADVVPASASGFSVGSDTITATLTHTGSGKVLTKTWNLAVTDYQIQAHPSYPTLYADRSVSSMTNAVTQYVFTVPGVDGNTGAYTVEWTGAENLNATLVPKVGTDKNYWFVDVTPKTGGLTTGTSVITAKLTHSGGKVLTKTWNLTVTEGGITAHGTYASLFTDRTVKPASTTMVQYLFTMPGNYADYSVVWSDSNSAGLNSTVVPNSHVANKYWFLNVTPGTGGFAAGSSTLTATVTHIPTGNVYTKTWNLTVKP